MFESAEVLQKTLLEKNPRDFVSRYIFEPIPFAFNGNIDTWIEWKTILAQKINVDPKDVVITGSASIGYSLNPTKNYRQFNDVSDIDCGIVSQHHFDVAWRYLRQMRPNWLSLPSEVRRAIESHRKNYIFSGTIATDYMLALLPFGKEWQEALDHMSMMPPTKGRDVKLRIYKDYEALRHYQAHTISKLRDSLISDKELEKGIPLEE